MVGTKSRIRFPSGQLLINDIEISLKSDKRSILFKQLNLLLWRCKVWEARLYVCPCNGYPCKLK